MNLRTFSLLGSSLFFLTSAFCESEVNHLFTPELTPENAPWLTGPLLAPTAHTIPAGHINIEPYVFFNTVTSTFNNDWHSTPITNFYSLVEQTFVQVGVCNFIDVQIAPQFVSQWTENKNSVQVADLPLILDIQLYSDRPGTRWPAVKLALICTAPLGKYDHLNPNKLGTDGVGTGSWRPSAILAFSRLYQLPNGHFLAPRLSFNYTVPLTVPVNGLSIYGGAEDTQGKILPGNYFWTDFGLEYTLTRNWVFAMDLYYQHTNKDHFFGNPGTVAGLLGPTPASIGRPSSETLSLAPAIEYNWSINVGLIAGVWFSLAGKNAARFTNGVVAINIYM